MTEIWIRSQNKNYLGNYVEVMATGDMILGYANGENDSTLLGEYATEERALQVLDEIQDKINYSRLEDIAYAGVTGVAIHDGVYQMPAE